MRQKGWCCFVNYKFLLRLACVVFLALFFSNCGMNNQQKPMICPFTITLAKTADSINCSATRNIYRIEIHSASGIGSAVLHFDNIGDSQRIQVALHTKGLEQLTISDGKKRLQTAYSSTAGSLQIPRTFMSIKNNYPEELPADHPNYLPLKIEGVGKDGPIIPLKSGYFSLLIPTALHQNTDSLKISWIDFYR